MTSRKTRVKEGKQSYADGTPFDTLRYLQAKLLLKPDRLSSLDRFRELGKLTRRTAKSLNVGFREDPEVDEAPRVREIIFVDTPDFRLYNNGFILRRRIAYVDGFPAGDPEIVFKFRYPDLRRAAALDVGPESPGDIASSSRRRRCRSRTTWAGTACCTRTTASSASVKCTRTIALPCRPWSVSFLRSPP